MVTRFGNLALLTLVSALWLSAAGCGDDITNIVEVPTPTFTPDPIVTQAQLQTALNTAVSSTNGGLDNPMWATVVDRAGVVVAVVHSGPALDVYIRIAD